MDSKPPYSYRDDPAVPGLPDAGPIFFVDGDCALCSRWARIVARRDKAGIARICPVQSPTGRAVIAHYGLDADDPTTWLYLEDGKAFDGIPGIVAAGRRLGGWLRPLAAVLARVPPGLGAWLYARMARNRYTLLGRADLCALPDPEIRARLIR
ncbi:MAG: thiol-disulfide oxidoreductase DCC family protein [Paracoccaceae bacterium]